MHSRRSFINTAASACAVGSSFALYAQTAKPLQIVVGFPPGGGTDLLARQLAEKLRGAYPEGVLVDNRPGAAGRIALEYVKAAPADGNILLFTPDFLFTIFPNTYKKLSYDPVRDFVPVASVASSGLALSVGPLVPSSVRTVPELVQWCKANPKQASFASSGAGGIFHLLGVMFNQATALDLAHVGYKGGAPALLDLVGGQIAASFNGIGEVMPYHKSGKVRMLATFGPKRSPHTPEIPTMAELGYKDFVVESWVGIFAPAKTPASAVTKLNSAVSDILRSPEFSASVEKLSMEPYANTSSGFASVAKADMERWAPIVKASGFTAED